MIGATFAIIQDIAELRKVNPTNKTKLFYLIEQGKEGHWYYDSADTTSTDNVGTIVVSTTGGRRFKRITDKEVYPEWFGAKGDGTTDDRDALYYACQFASLNKKIVSLSANTTYALASQLPTFDNLTIEGNNATLKVSGANTGINVNSNSNVKIRNLNFDGGGSGTISSGVASCLVYAYQPNRLTIENCKFNNSRNGGVCVIEGTNVRILHNEFTNNNGYYDVACGYGVSTTNFTNVHIIGNTCTSSVEFGVHVQGVGKNIFIKRNSVSNKKKYGIVCYTNTTGALKIENIVVKGNVVEDVQNDNTNFSGFLGGPGIYMSDVYDFTVSGNILRRTMINRTEVPLNTTLPPGSISINTCSKYNVVDNIIETTEGCGIAIGHPDSSSASKAAIIRGNSIVDAKKYGIRLIGQVELTIAQNDITGRTSNGTIGIDCTNAGNSGLYSLNISDNRITICDIGIEVYKNTGMTTLPENIVIANNIITDCTQQYMYLDQLNNLTLKGNICAVKSVAHTANVYALSLSTCTNVIISNNQIVGKSGNLLSRGLNTASCAKVLVVNNTILNISNQQYIFAVGSSTNIYFYGNNTDRLSNPLFSKFNVSATDDPYNDSDISVRWGTAIPTGYWSAKGSIVWNQNAASGQPSGWICVTAGTPGTWKVISTLP
ncbi:MAG: right-handed parallel beta-helix repeat-containing protein [Spirosomataceae bacterium]